MIGKFRTDLSENKARIVEFPDVEHRIILALGELFGKVSSRNGALRNPCVFLRCTGLSYRFFDRAFVKKRAELSYEF